MSIKHTLSSWVCVFLVLLLKRRNKTTLSLSLSERIFGFRHLLIFFQHSVFAGFIRCFYTRVSFYTMQFIESTENQMKPLTIIALISTLVMSSAVAASCLSIDPWKWIGKCYVVFESIAQNIQHLMANE